MKKNLCYLFAIIGFLAFASHTAIAQNYHPFTTIKNSGTTFQLIPVSLSQSGEKLLHVTSSRDQKQPTIVFNLYNPDLSLFKTMNIVDKRILSLEALRLGNHGVGFDVFESEEGVLTYLLAYSGEKKDTDGKIKSYRNVCLLNADGTMIGVAPTSWKTYELLTIDGKQKVNSFAYVADTTYHDHGYDVSFRMTSMVLDVESGKTDFVFPKGVTISGIYEVEGRPRIFTQKESYGAFTDDQLTMQSYNTDYTPYKKYVINSFKAANDLRDYNPDYHFFSPLVGKSGVYFSHSYAKLDGSRHYFMTDAEGDKVQNDFATKGLFGEVLYLPHTQKEVLLTRDTLYTFPSFQKLGAYSTYYTDRDGQIVFVHSDSEGMKLYDENLTLQKNISLPERYQRVGLPLISRNVVQGATAFVLSPQDKGVYIVSDKGEKIYQNDTLSLLKTIPSIFLPELPVFLQVSGEKYGRFLTTIPMGTHIRWGEAEAIQQWQRVGQFNVSPTINQQPISTDVCLVRMDGDEVVQSDTLKATPTAIYKNLPEGTYYLRTLTDAATISTYYPNNVLWEKAQKIVYTGDSEMTDYTIQVQPLPRQTDGKGTIKGSITHQSAAQAVAQSRVIANQVKAYNLFLVQKKEQEEAHIIAMTQNDTDGNYQFTQVDWGTYEVWINVPQRTTRSVHTVQLTAHRQTAEKIDYTITSDAIVAQEPSNVAQHTLSTLHIYPNPVKNIVSVQLANDLSHSTYRMEMLTIDGKSIRQFVATAHELNRGVQIPVSHLDKGIYLLQLTDKNGQTTTKKIIKQ